MRAKFIQCQFGNGYDQNSVRNSYDNNSGKMKTQIEQTGKLYDSNSVTAIDYWITVVTIWKQLPAMTIWESRGFFASFFCQTIVFTTPLGTKIHFNSVKPLYCVNSYTCLIWENLRWEFGRAHLLDLARYISGALLALYKNPFL